MPEKKENLSTFELGAVNAMIAYLQNNNKASADDSLDDLYKNCYQMAVGTNSYGIQYDMIIPTANCGPGPASSLATGGNLRSGTSSDSFFGKLSDGKQKITLDELIAIRNKNSKK